MELALKNIKYVKAASRETMCFTATLYVDGVKAGEVSNQGRGGPTTCDNHAIEKKIEAYAATLPALHAFGMDLPQSFELLVNELVNDHLLEKDLKRLMKNRIIGLDAKGALKNSKPVRPDQLQTFFASPEHMQKFGLVTYFHKIDFAEALKLFKKAVSE